MTKSQCIMQNRIALYTPRPSRAGKYVLSPLLIIRQPKLVLIHTRTDVLGITASERDTNEQCCTNIPMYHGTQTATVATYIQRMCTKLQ